MVKIESIKELRERFDGLISSIESENLSNPDYTELVTHKYMLVSLHAHSERCKLDKFLKRSSEKLIYRKQYNLYKNIEAILSKKAHECSSLDMFNKLVECKKLVEKNM
jgi:hypothetical protein